MLPNVDHWEILDRPNDSTLLFHCEIEQLKNINHNCLAEQDCQKQIKSLIQVY